MKTQENLTGFVDISDNIPFVLDENGFYKQVDPKPFKYDVGYKEKQSTNKEMAWLRLGWLSNHIPFEALTDFNVVDIGAGNGVFVEEGKKVFKRIVPYDLAGDSIEDTELYSTTWDLIVMSDVLEHYHSIDDLWTIPFRYALISFPETPPTDEVDITTWRHYKPDEHIYMMNRWDFRKWVEKNGCSVLGCGSPEDFLRKRWDKDYINISTFLICRR